MLYRETLSWELKKKKYISNKLQSLWVKNLIGQIRMQSVWAKKMAQWTKRQNACYIGIRTGSPEPMESWDRELPITPVPLHEMEDQNLS